MKHPERKQGHLYVVLAEPFDCEGHPHVEQFIEVEDHEGRGSGASRSFEEGQYRLLEFPAEARVRELEAERSKLAAWLERIDGGDAPCSDASQLRQWAYEAITLGHSPPDYEQPEALQDASEWLDALAAVKKERDAAEARCAELEAERDAMSDRMGWTVEDHAKKAVVMADLRTRCAQMRAALEESVVVMGAALRCLPGGGTVVEKRVLAAARAARAALEEKA